MGGVHKQALVVKLAVVLGSGIYRKRDRSQAEEGREKGGEEGDKWEPVPSVIIARRLGCEARRLVVKPLGCVMCYVYIYIYNMYVYIYIYTHTYTYIHV